MLMEKLHYNFLVRWFVRRSIDEPVWDVMVINQKPGTVAFGPLVVGLHVQDVIARPLCLGGGVDNKLAVIAKLPK